MSWPQLKKNLTVLLEPTSIDAKALTKETQQHLIALLNATPNGVIRMSDAVKGVVETSLNVGVVTMNENEAEIICLIRSLIDSGKDYVVGMLTAIGQLAGAKTAPKRRLPRLAARSKLTGDGVGAGNLPKAV